MHWAQSWRCWRLLETIFTVLKGASHLLFHLFVVHLHPVLYLPLKHDISESNLRESITTTYTSVARFEMELPLFRQYHVIGWTARHRRTPLISRSLLIDLCNVSSTLHLSRKHMPFSGISSAIEPKLIIGVRHHSGDRQIFKLRGTVVNRGEPTMEPRTDIIARRNSAPIPERIETSISTEWVSMLLQFSYSFLGQSVSKFK